MNTILITGCGSGIGREAALSLANRGHFIYATTYTEKESYELNKLNEKWCLPLFSFKLDITLKEDRDKVDSLDIDILINNAAIGDSGSVAEIDVNKYRKVFETNVFSSIELTQEILKNMIKRKRGRIIFISSLFGLTSKAFLSPYCATKFALEAIAPALNDELKLLKGVNIPVILIEPGAYATGFNEKNIGKQFNWMNVDSYFENSLRKLKFRQYAFFKISESTNIESIVNKYIAAVEDKKPKKRYVAPAIQEALIKTKNILTE